MPLLTLHSLLPLSPTRLMRLCTCLAGLIVAINASGLRQLLPTLLPSGGDRPARMLAAPAPGAASERAEERPTATQAELAERQGGQGGGFDFEVLTLSREDGIDFRRDWWKYSLMLVAAAVAGFYLVRAGAQLLRFVSLLLCVAFASFLAYLLGPPLEPWLAEHAAFLDSPRCPLLYWSYFTVFLAAYAVATVILRLLRRPIDMKAPPQRRRRKSDD
ncbi:MAG: hypothetical protein ACI4WT_08390 [Oligosphaeraceae bacterium]